MHLFLTHDFLAVVTFKDASIDPMSCYQIRYDAYFALNIYGDTCQLVQDEARETCCLYTNSTPPLGSTVCTVCGGDGGGGITFPDANITRLSGENVSCSFVGEYAEKGYLDETQCAYFQSIAGPCCPVSNQTTTVVNDDPASPAASLGRVTAGLIMTGLSFLAAALN